MPSAANSWAAVVWGLIAPSERDPSPFKFVALGVLGILLLAELVGLVRDRTRWRGGLFRSLVWLAAAAAIYDPSLVAMVSVPLGIGRAADLVIYVVALAFLGTTFYFYSRQVQLSRQVTELARLIAIDRAQRGESAKGPGAPPVEKASDPPA
jgi:hypothetical protein